MWIRFIIYGAVGLLASLAWNAVEDRLRGTGRDWRLRGSATLWAFPLFGLLVFLFEPAHDGLRSLPWFMRGATYALGFWTIEFTAGLLLRTVLGKCPWDYSAWRGNLRGVITWEFGAVWFMAGLLLEPVHDFLLLLTPAMANLLGL